MSSLFERFKGRREPSSAEIAKERLKLVLVTDRSNLSPDKLQRCRRDYRRDQTVYPIDVRMCISSWSSRTVKFCGRYSTVPRSSYHADAGLAESPGTEAEPVEAVGPDGCSKPEQDTGGLIPPIRIRRTAT
jgi:hypothetical protein